MERCPKRIEPQRTGCLAEFERGNGFNSLCPVVILLDATYTTWSANRAAGDPDDSDITLNMQLIEFAFTAFYMTELLIKLKVHGKFHFYNSNMAWNWFDFILVCQSLLDVILTYVVATSGGSA